MLRAFFLCLGLIVLAPLSAHADERILLFKSLVTLDESGVAEVEENITVRAEGRQIKRGIVREFPTNYRDVHGNRVRTTFDVVSVRRDGVEQPYHTERKNNGVYLYIGKADVRIPPGTYTYQIRYRTNRQVGYFKDFDEFYWNVTGNGWRLPIDQVTYELSLPRHQEAIRIDGYTGGYGEAGKDFRITGNTVGLVSVETTRGFSEYEGLTVAVAFPKGTVYQPNMGERTAYFFRDNAGTFLALIGLLTMTAYYLYFWDQRGRDPIGGAIIPRFGPPDGFSPAAARFVHRMAYDRKAFSAAVINMAVKGYLTIEDDDRTFRLRKTGNNAALLTKGEERIANHLFGLSDSIKMENENHTEISAAIRSFEDGLQGEYQHAYFDTNRGYFYFGAAMTIAFMIGAALLNAALTIPPISIAAQVLIGAIAAMTSIFFLNLTRHRETPRLGLTSLSFTDVLRASRWLVMIFVFAPQFLFGLFFSRDLGMALPLLAVLFGILNGTFYILLKAPTKLGRRVMDDIEGFKLYLSTAEEDRLNMLNPPEKTPELFERYLPFALALGVDNKWSEKFSSVLAAAGMEDEDHRYRPSWYSGRHFRTDHLNSFSSSLNSALATSIASSAHAPGSSSGSGGGGFSGGGGGGGGGGGW